MDLCIPYVTLQGSPRRSPLHSKCGVYHKRPPFFNVEPVIFWIVNKLFVFPTRISIISAAFPQDLCDDDTPDSKTEYDV